MQNDKVYSKNLDYDVIVIPGGPDYTETLEYATHLFNLQKAPLIISGSVSQTDFMYKHLKPLLDDSGVDSVNWIINETDVLKRFYHTESDEEYKRYQPTTTIQNACCTKWIVKGKNLGNKIAVIRADYHERVPYEFELVYGPKYKIIDHAVRTNISSSERTIRVAHEKIAKIQNMLYLYHKTPGDDQSIYILDKNIDPIFKRFMVFEHALFGFAGLASRDPRKS